MKIKKWEKPKQHLTQQADVIYTVGYYGLKRRNLIWCKIPKLKFQVVRFICDGRTMVSLFLRLTNSNFFFYRIGKSKKETLFLFVIFHEPDPYSYFDSDQNRKAK